MTSRPQLMIHPDKLRTLRLGKTLTQRELAEKAGVNLGTIKLIESDPDARGIFPTTARKLAKALDCAVGEFTSVQIEAVS